MTAILASTKVVRTALQDASSIGRLIVIPDAIITEDPRRKPHRPSPMVAWKGWIFEIRVRNLRPWGF